MDQNEVLKNFVEEALEHLHGIEVSLISVPSSGIEISDDLVTTTFRAIQSVTSAAESLGLTEIHAVSHRLERVFGLAPNSGDTPAVGDTPTKEWNLDRHQREVILQAVRRLKLMIVSIQTTVNDLDNSEICQRLDAIPQKKATKTRNSAGRRRPPAPHVDPNSSVLPAGATSDEVIRRVEDRLDDAEVTLLSAGNGNPPDVVAG